MSGLAPRNRMLFKGEREGREALMEGPGHPSSAVFLHARRGTVVAHGAERRANSRWALRAKGATGVIIAIAIIAECTTTGSFWCDGLEPGEGRRHP